MQPVLFTVGSFNVYAFGFFLALAFLFSTFVVWKNAKEELKEEEYLDAYLYTCVVALVSARIVYIVLHFNTFGLSLLKYILVRETAGLSLLGGLFSAVLFLFFYCKKKGESFLGILDLFSLSAGLALFLAKIGGQLAGAGFGKETNFILGIKVAGKAGRYHPVELYESLLFLVVFIVLYFIYQKVKRNIWPQGLVSLLFGASFAIIIFALEFLKDYPVYLYGLSLRQISALILFLVTSVPLILKIKKFQERKI